MSISVLGFGSPSLKESQISWKLFLAPLLKNLVTPKIRVSYREARWMRTIQTDNRRQKQTGSKQNKSKAK